MNSFDRKFSQLHLNASEFSRVDKCDFLTMTCNSFKRIDIYAFVITASGLYNQKGPKSFKRL